jgi:hypothetical protein
MLNIYDLLHLQNYFFWFPDFFFGSKKRKEEGDEPVEDQNKKSEGSHSSTVSNPSKKGIAFYIKDDFGWKNSKTYS